MPVPEMALSPAKSLRWEAFPGMAVPRVYCASALVAGRLYVLGGCGEGGTLLDSAEVLDLESQSWCRLPPLPTARAGASAVALGDQLVVLGGMDVQQNPLASVEVYHPDEGKWERKDGLGQASMGIAALERVCLDTRAVRLQPAGVVLSSSNKIDQRQAKLWVGAVVTHRYASVPHPGDQMAPLPPADPATLPPPTHPPVCWAQRNATPLCREGVNS
ncbi:hypothetical protein P4O66_004581 [Electrophorus voltai]|uniref:Kelch domain-containing protein 8B n=1 Tax=Electrophorus voltai TaxID=2609070 RepID=A0AAD8ZMK4_9TELE|nr:hypothetical protein P4O66_004581 [Electrophorus voltai]